MLAAALSVGIALTACGKGDKRSALRSASQPAFAGDAEPASWAALKGDEDDDDTPANHTPDRSRDTDVDFDDDSPAKQSKTFFDSDDAAFRAAGQPARASERRAVETLVERYYQAARASDGRSACAMLFTIYADAVPEDFGRGSPTFSRGKSCATVMTKLFRHAQPQLSTLFQLGRVVEVRVEGNQGRAIIGGTSMPASYVALHRERGAWRIDDLFPRRMP